MVEITVRGAGIFGLSIAFECTMRGASVQVIDPNGPGAGSSGGVVGALAPHVPENWNPKKEFQLDSLLMAEGFWARVQETGGKTAGYQRSGRVQPVQDEAGLQLAQRRVESARLLWPNPMSWNVERVSNSSWWPETSTGWVIRDSLSALLHPRQAIQALSAALQERGVRIETEGENRGAVVWATGLEGLETLNAAYNRSVGNGVKGQAAVLGYAAPGAPQLFADGVHIIPHLNGTVAIGSTSEKIFNSAHATDEQLDAVIASARLAVPVLREARVIERWAGVRPRTRSRAPMLGRWPNRQGHYIANGGFKIGFGMAPKIAVVMADLILDGINEIPEGFGVSASL